MAKLTREKDGGAWETVVESEGGAGYPLGLTGATAATRYVGATAAGAPASGTFAVGDFIIDQTGKIYVCTVAGTPGTWTVTGSSPVTAREQLYGSQITIANSGRGYVPWSSVASGSTLLTLTDPANPVVITSGVYAVSAEVQCATAMTAGGKLGLLLSLDDANEAATSYTLSSPSSAAISQPEAALSLTYYVPAGGTITVGVDNFDGVGSVDFNLVNGVVQRIS